MIVLRHNLRIRIPYFILSGLVMVLGLLSRKLSGSLPEFINFWLGDFLWALMVYFLFRILHSNFTIKTNLLISVSFCYLIEFSQLVHGAFIDSIRATPLGGLVLGFGFLWSDLAAYLAGVLTGAGIDYVLHPYLSRKTGSEQN